MQCGTRHTDHATVTCVATGGTVSLSAMTPRSRDVYEAFLVETETEAYQLRGETEPGH